ncbi:hypothetical protein [Leisingera aquaemixtae]|uniref:Uncharacterized protein n=1 Tax=Leisingera aquaemixtae TaxID=1396826 RepID=A0A0N7M4K1_9RHOB|nr:hypothetical protein [Leisingera aquaemixtae]CUH99858.1 hypothetical protein PHA8399_01984 [Leisingera aquaemixtae]
MKITCICGAGLPGHPETAASVSDDVLTVDGAAYDLSAVPDGGYADPEGDHPFVGQIQRIGGELHLSLRWFYDTVTAEANQPSAAPELTVISGPLPDPIIRKPTLQEA